MDGGVGDIYAGFPPLILALSLVANFMVTLASGYAVVQLLNIIRAGERERGAVRHEEMRSGAEVRRMHLQAIRDYQNALVELKGLDRQLHEVDDQGFRAT